jgi:hypothetical protein
VFSDLARVVDAAHAALQAETAAVRPLDNVFSSARDVENVSCSPVCKVL